MTRAYLRLDPAFSERKADYPDGPYATLIDVLCLAELQPQRGRFRSLSYLKALLGRRGKHVNYLVEHHDLVEDKAHRVYIPGWDEWQEGDWKVGERVARIRERRGDPPVSTGAQRTANWRLRTKVFERDEFTCRYCGIADYPREWLVLEHVDPDGPDDETNLVTACRPCNKRKGSGTPEAAGMVLRDVSQVTRHPAERDLVSLHGAGVIDGGSAGGGSKAVPAVQRSSESRDSAIARRQAVETKDRR